jgi:hypothetical protein
MAVVFIGAQFGVVGPVTANRPFNLNLCDEGLSFACSFDGKALACFAARPVNPTVQPAFDGIPSTDIYQSCRTRTPKTTARIRSVGDRGRNLPSRHDGQH